MTDTTIPSITRAHFQQNLDVTFDRVLKQGQEIIIERPEGQSVVLMSLADYNSWQETVYLFSTEANRQHLARAMHEAAESKGESLDIKALIAEREG
jgi:antitoxin YefM